MLTLRTMLALTVLAGFLTSRATAGAPDYELNTLLDFKYANDVCGSTSLSSWQSGSDPYSWTGVKIENDQVVELKFDNHSDLCASLPAAWSVLTGLTHLQIGGTKLVGTLPDAWSSLNRLILWNMTENPRVSGTLPTAWGTWHYLALFHMHNHSEVMGTLPASWSNWTQLNYFHMKHNQASGRLPVEWRKWPIVNYFCIEDNLVSGTLPAVWSVMSRLTTFRINRTRVSGTLPDAWSNWTQLADFALHDSNVTGTLPASWGNWTELKQFQMQQNKVGGSLPAAWSTWSQLRLFLFERTLVRGALPASWSNWTSLQWFAVQQVQITGTLPNSWSNLTSTAYFLLNTTELTGTLPAGWGNWTELTYLAIERSHVSGTIPSTWSNLQKLRIVSFTQNPAINGPLPSSWGNLTSLEGLTFKGGSFTGTLPSSWSSLGKLTYLAVGNSSGMYGTLPVGWSMLTSLQGLSISDAPFTGTLPPSYSQMAGLTGLRVSNTSIRGPLPDEWGVMKSMASLALHDNRLEGTLPATWGNFTPLYVLDAHSNNLSGPVPTSWQQTFWDKLTFVHLASNQLTGPIPPIPAPAILYNMSSNSLTGTIPAVPPGVVYLHVANNRLSGGIPPLENATSLAYVILDNNTFTSLPSTFNASRVLLLSAANNALEGSIPAWPDLQALIFCDLSQNSLTGSLPPMWAKHSWQYLALDRNPMLGGRLPDPWPGQVDVLLLRNTSISGCLPTTWPQNSTVRLLALATNRDLTCKGQKLPVSWGSNGSFASLDVLDLHNNNIKVGIPRAWLEQGAWPNNQTALQLGGLWETSARQSSSWRRDVCLRKDLRDKASSLVASNISAKVAKSLQDKFTNSLGEKVREMIDKVVVALNSTNPILWDAPDVGPRLKLQANGTSVSNLKDICSNRRAKFYVTVQWCVIGGTLLLLVLLYLIARRCKLLQRSSSGLSSGVSSNDDLPPGLASNKLRRTATASTKALKYWGGKTRHMLSLGLYWADIVSDLIILLAVWPKWPGIALLGVFMAQYLLSAGILTWRLWQMGWTCAPLLTPLLLPFLPILDSLSLLLLAMENEKWFQELTKDWLDEQNETYWHVLAMDWQGLFEMRDVMEVCLEAVPTSILQSVVYVLGNKPSIGWYLDPRKYWASAITSALQIVRLTGTLMYHALKNGESPLKVLWGFASYHRATTRVTGSGISGSGISSGSGGSGKRRARKGGKGASSSSGGGRSGSSRSVKAWKDGRDRRDKKLTRDRSIPMQHCVIELNGAQTVPIGLNVVDQERVDTGDTSGSGSGDPEWESLDTEDSEVVGAVNLVLVHDLETGKVEDK